MIITYAMKTISMVDLRTHSERIVRDLKRGEHMILSYRGEPLAELVPAASSSARLSPLEALNQAQGLLGRALTSGSCRHAVLTAALSQKSLPATRSAAVTTVVASIPVTVLRPCHEGCGQTADIARTIGGAVVPGLLDGRPGGPVDGRAADRRHIRLTGRCPPKARAIR